MFFLPFRVSGIHFLFVKADEASYALCTWNLNGYADLSQGQQIYNSILNAKIVFFFQL